MAEEGEPVALEELAERSGLNPSATYRLMRTLEQEGLVARAGRSRTYGIGGGLIQLSATVLNRVNIRSMARAQMQQILTLTGETVSLHIRNGSERVCVEALESWQPVRRVVDLGASVPLYEGPTGKIMTAFLPERDLEEMLDKAEDAGYDRDAIAAQLAAARVDGFIFGVGDRTPGVGAISVPVFDSDGVVASVTVSGPGERWSLGAMAEVVPEIVRAGAAISASLGHLAEGSSRPVRRHVAAASGGEGND